jgi:hypothetical protein
MIVHLLSLVAFVVAETQTAGQDSSNSTLAKACTPQSAGISHQTQPDTALAFLADPYYANLATTALTPPGYTVAYTNLCASNNANGYLTYTTLSEYNVQHCSTKCDAMDACNSFNICKLRLSVTHSNKNHLTLLDFERNPSVAPSDALCPNPPSVGRIRVRNLSLHTYVLHLDYLYSALSGMDLFPRTTL